ncbi:MAG: carbon-nitrogen family hydrolase [Verrucomicrobia bacterium]|nr:MAG: carbon-nitrogen family hydrolase [Verrucomicrobiota bacterium]
MRVLAVQYDIAWESRDANIAAVEAMVTAAAPPAGSLIILPEMGYTGFSMQPARVADSEARETENALCALARRHASWVLGGLVQRAEDGRGRNNALLAGPDGTALATYTKIHPFSHTGEHRRYVAGEEVVVAPAGPFQLAPFICYDLRFPEIFRTAVRRGADLMVVIANWPEARFAHWEVLLRARAIENQAWVIGVNRCGADPRFTYPGVSLIIAPDGATVARAGDGAEVLAADIAIEPLRQWREAFPVLRDLRERWTRG